MAVNRQNEPWLFMEPVEFLKNVTFKGTTVITNVSMDGSGSSIPPGSVVAAGPSGLEAADHDTPEHADRIVGIMLTDNRVIVSGEIVSPLLNFPWTGAIFVGLAGSGTVVPPATGFQQRIGVSTGPTSMVLAIGDAIILA